MSEMAKQRRCFQILILLVIFICGPKFCHGECCPDGWLSFQSSCYLFSNSAGVHFTEAEHYCKQHGAYLVSVETKSEDMFLKDFLARLKGMDYWIGLTDEIIEGLWVWQDSDIPANYTSWGPGEPNSSHGDQDCVFYHSGENYMWADIMCSSSFRPLCEKSKPAPGMITAVG